MNQRIKFNFSLPLIIVLWWAESMVWCQNAPGFYYVVFKDKTGTPYELEYPQAFLSSKSLERRLRLGIPIIEEDLPVNPQYVQGVLQASGGVTHHLSKWFNSMTLNLSLLDSAAQVSAIEQVTSLPYVQEVKSFSINETGAAKRRLKQEDEMGPIELSVPNQYGYGLGFHQLNMVNTIRLHEADFRGQGVDVGIFDSGWLRADQMKAFAAIRDEGRLVMTRDFVNPQMPNVFDKSTHGTNVWGIMAGVMQDQFIGAAPMANYYLFQTEDVDSEYRIEEDNWVAAAELADSLGLDVINSSLGYSLFDDTTMNYQYSDMTGKVSRASIAAEKLAKKGVIVVNSAGNSGNGAWHYITAPADADGILAVGAVDSTIKVAGFSSHGPTYDGRVKPNVSAMGVRTYYPFSDDKIDRGNGTSYSSPIIAGSTASLLSAFDAPQSPIAVRDAIEKTGSLFPGYNADMGFGIPDFWWAYNLLIQNEALPSKQLDCIFPNPGRDIINVKTKGAPVQSLRVTNAYGQLLSSIGWTQSWNKNYIQLSVTHLPQGFYFLTIETEEGVSTSPFEKIND
jgi:serine protease AprX